MSHALGGATSPALLLIVGSSVLQTGGCASGVHHATASRNQPGAAVRIWVISNDRAGTVNPAMGLASTIAERLPGKCIIEHKRPARTIWHNLPPGAWPRRALDPATYGKGFAPPWPQLAISNGHSAIAAAVAVKKTVGNAMFSLHLQAAAAAGRCFDLVVVPTHDRAARSDNEWAMLGSFAQFPLQQAGCGQNGFDGRLDKLPEPVLAILLGGNNSCYLLDTGTASTLSGILSATIKSAGGSFLLSGSRRTPVASFRIFRQRLAGLPGHSWFPGEQGANPYHKYLQRASIFAVSCDSINMLSEACAMRKAVYILPLRRRFFRSDGKFRRFHRQLQQASVARPMGASLDPWPTPGLQESARLVEKVLASL